MAVKIVTRALLEKEHPQQADDEQRARRNAEHEVGDLQPARRGNRQLRADQHELDRERRDEGERAEVMEEGEECGHGAGSPLIADVIRQRLPYNGKLSCFFIGISTCLSRNMASDRAIRRRVECGMMTSSI